MLEEKVENGQCFFAARGQTTELLQFKIDLNRLSMVKNCGSFSVRSCRPLPHAKLSGTNPEIGTLGVSSELLCGYTNLP